MKKEIKRDMAVYAVWIAATVLFYFFVIPNQVYLSGSAKAESFSPDTFPRFVTIVLFLAAVGGEVNAWRLYRRQSRLGAQGAGRTAKARSAGGKAGREHLAAFIPYIVFLLVLAYGVLFAKLGFIAATAIVPPVVLLVIGCRKARYYLIYYVFAAVLYLLFKYLLLVPIR